MKREFIINIILLIFINLMIKPLYIFGIEAKIQNIVGPTEYGMYFAYFNFVFLFQFINDPGLQNWNAQYVPKNREKINTHFPYILQSKILLASIFIGIVGILGSVLGFGNMRLLLLLSVNMILSSLFMVIRTTLSGMGFYRVDSLLSALDKAMMIIILAYLIWFSSSKEDLSIFTFVYGQLAAYIISVVVALIILLTKIDWKFTWLSTSKIKEIVLQCLPFVLALIFMTTYNKLDGVMLSRLLSDDNYQAGVYASAYRIYDAANMTGYLFAALLLPMFSANIAHRDTLVELVNIGVKYIFIMSWIIVVVVFFYGRDIMSFIYTDYNTTYYLTLVWLIVGYMMVALAYIYGTFLVAADKINRLNVIFGIGVIINLLLNLVFIPKYGAVGAALTTFITQFLILIGQFYVAQDVLKMSFRRRDFIRPGLYIFITILIFGTLKSVNYGNWIFNLALGTLFCLLLSFFLKMIDKKDIVGLLKKNN